eukprot:6647797-Ditylum_brightwellii.AAC.1
MGFTRHLLVCFFSVASHAIELAPIHHQTIISRVRGGSFFELSVLLWNLVADPLGKEIPTIEEEEENNEL